MKFFEQLWKPFTQESNLPSLVGIGQVVFSQEDVLCSLYNLYNTQVNRYMPPHRRCCGGIKNNKEDTLTL
jgi:hypothetical protein